MLCILMNNKILFHLQSIPFWRPSHLILPWLFFLIQDFAFFYQTVWKSFDFFLSQLTQQPVYWGSIRRLNNTVVGASECPVQQFVISTGFHRGFHCSHDFAYFKDSKRIFTAAQLILLGRAGGSVSKRITVLRMCCQLSQIYINLLSWQHIRSTAILLVSSIQMIKAFY